MDQYEWTFVVETMSDESVERIYADFDATASRHGDRELLTLTVGGPSASDAAKHAIATLNERYSVQVIRSFPQLVGTAGSGELAYPGQGDHADVDAWIERRKRLSLGIG